MRPACLFVILTLGMVGCKTVSHDDEHCEHCKQKQVVVEVAAPPQNTGAPQPNVTALPPTPLAAPPFGAPMMGAPPGYGAPPTNVTVRDRTGFGLVLDCIRIPIPFLRPVAVPRPAEVTYQTQLPPPNYGFGAPMGPCPPMGYGMPGYGMPGYGMPMGMPMAGMPMGMPMGQGCPSPMGAGGPPNQQVGAGQISDQELDDLLKKCERLKQLKAQRDAAGEGK